MNNHGIGYVNTVFQRHGNFYRFQNYKDTEGKTHAIEQQKQLMDKHNTGH